MPADVDNFGEVFQCTTTFPTTVRVTIIPERSVEGGPFDRIKVTARGYLKREDIAMIEIFFGGATINFADYFINIARQDLDGDGVEDEYPFHLNVYAVPVSFIEELASPDALDLRDPMPEVTMAPECEQP